MKNIKHIKRTILMYVLLCTSAVIIAAIPQGPDGAYTWSILNNQLVISPGSVITGAILTVHNVSGNGTTGNGTLYVHLLNNPDVSKNNYADGQPGDYFEGYGVYLAQISEPEFSGNPSDIVIDLTQINDQGSSVWSVFGQPFVVTLADASQVSLSSALLSLLDYAGTGSSFGVGLDCDGVTFDGLSLELTVRSMKNNIPQSTIFFKQGNVNSPVLQSIPNQNIDAGQKLTFTVTATDADSDLLSYSASNLPQGAVFANQTFTWTPSNQQVGIYPVVFMVSDGGKIIMQTITITVNDAYANHAPSINAIADKIITTGNALTFTVQADDPDGDAVSLSVENLPDGAFWTNNIFTWTPSASQAGIYDVIFTANDGNGGLDSTIIQISVTPPVSEWKVLTYDDFESGWGNYTDGGNNCSLYTNSKYAPQGRKAAMVQNGNGDTSSFVLTNGIDVKTPGYSEIKIAFSYYPVSMDNSTEGFRLDYWNGTKWLTLKRWHKSLDFENNRIYSDTVKISRSGVVFPTNMKIRFVCEASDNIDLVMIDLIAISAK